MVQRKHCQAFVKTWFQINISSLVCLTAYCSIFFSSLLSTTIQEAFFSSISFLLIDSMMSSQEKKLKKERRNKKTKQTEIGKDKLHCIVGKLELQCERKTALPSQAGRFYKGRKKQWRKKGIKKCAENWTSHDRRLNMDFPCLYWRTL